MYSAAMSPPRWPVPRPSSKSLARNFTCARMFSGPMVQSLSSLSPGAPCGPDRAACAIIAATPSTDNPKTIAVVFISVLSISEGGISLGSLLGPILQQIFQLRHELLHVLEIHVDGCEPHIGHFIQLFQPLHDQFSDLRGGQLAFRGVVYHAFDFVHDSFEFGRRHRSLLASLEQPLQNLSTLKPFPAPVFLDDHVGDFVNALVGGEAASAFEALAAAANGVAGAAFAGVNHLIVHVRAERTLHSVVSPRPEAAFAPPATCSITASFSRAAMRRNSPSDQPSRISSGTPARLPMANVISHKTIATATAGSLSTPKIAVYAMIEPACEPPPTPGSCTADPASVIASTSMASLRL